MLMRFYEIYSVLQKIKAGDVLQHIDGLPTTDVLTMLSLCYIEMNLNLQPFRAEDMSCIFRHVTANKQSSVTSFISV